MIHDPIAGKAAPCKPDQNGAALRSTAVVIVNADDWGRNVDTTDRSLNCLLHGAISSVSAMVFMEDSERAAILALQHDVDAGLHLNFTTPFTAPQCPALLQEHQQRLARFLNSFRYARFAYHPGLANSFEYVVRTQSEEFQRLYGIPPRRMDGHHHMHLCQNVFLQKLLPANIIVRRNFTFMDGEVGYINRTYRLWQDRRLARNHRITDFFFDLEPPHPSQRFASILELARQFNVEMETHPINDKEYGFLMNEDLIGCAENVAIARGYVLRPYIRDVHAKEIA
jgi:hypothetical protein